MKPELSVVGIDLAKSVFYLVGMDERGKIIFRKRLARGEVMPFMAKLPRVLVGMEACGGAHYWARQLREQGHEVKLMAPQYVKPYVKTNKNDLRDAEAIAEAVTRESMENLGIMPRRASPCPPWRGSSGLERRGNDAGPSIPTVSPLIIPLLYCPINAFHRSFCC